MSNEAKFNFLKNNTIFSQRRLTIASYPGGKSSKTKHSHLYKVYYDIYIKKQKIFRVIEPFSGMTNFFLNIHPGIESVILNDADFYVFSLLEQIKNNVTNFITLIKDVYDCMSETLYYQFKYFNTVNDQSKNDQNNIYDVMKSQLINTKPYKNKYSNDITIHPVFDQIINTSIQIQSAIKMLVILNCSHSGAGGGFSEEKSKRNWVKEKEWKSISNIFNDKNVIITNLDYLEFIRKYRSTLTSTDLIYLDPPYYKVADKGRLYGNKFNRFSTSKEILDLISALKSLPDDVSWILSNKNHPDIIKMFESNLNDIKISFKGYNTYNDMNRTKNANQELLISKI